MRGGEMAMTGGTIVAGGDPVFVGKVGDSKVVVTPSGVVFDRDAGYYDAPNAKVDIGRHGRGVRYIEGNRRSGHEGAECV